MLTRHQHLPPTPRATRPTAARIGLSLTVILLGLHAFPVRMARAQNASGSMVGAVYSEAGEPLPGVRVTAESPTQIGGKKNTFTTSEGTFRLPGLQPGVFTVTASAPGMTTKRQDGVQVDISAPADVNFIMEVQTEVEQVEIVSKAATINTSSAKLKQVYRRELIEKLPANERNDWYGLLEMAPGVRGAGGNRDRPMVRGASGNKNAATIDGFNTIDPSNGVFGQIVDNQTLVATEITTAGLGAANGSTSGGAVNMVTKSGSNKLEVSGEVKHRMPSLRLFTDRNDQQSHDEYYTYANVNVGGPIIRDRLWFFTSLTANATTRYPHDDPEGLRPPNAPPNRYARLPTLQKLTWQLTPRHKLMWTSLITYERSDYVDIPWTPRLVDPEADQQRDFWKWMQGLTWEALLGDSLFLRSQVGYGRQTFHSYPQSCEWDPNCLEAPRYLNQARNGYRFGNYEWDQSTAAGDLQLKTTLEYFYDSKRAGSHSVTLGADMHLLEWDRSERRPGDVMYEVRNDQQYRRTQYCNNVIGSLADECLPGALKTSASGRKLDLFLQDAWKVTRYFTLTPGLGFHQSVTRNELGQDVLNQSAPTLHLSAAWDATHDGRTVLRGGINQYVDLGTLEIAQHRNRALASKVCEWNPETLAYDRNCSFSTGAPNTNTIGLPCGPDAPECKRDIDVPRTLELAAGGEREIWDGIAVGADVVYRRFTRQFEDFETNRVWNRGGTALATDGPYRNGEPRTISDLSTLERAQRRYIGVTGQVNKRDGRLQMSAAYTWSMLRGAAPVMEGGYRSNFGTNPAQDIYYDADSYLATDARHDIRVMASYAFWSWLHVGGTYQFRTGEPFNRWFYNPTTGAWDTLNARQGYDAGRDINDPGDDTGLRNPDITQFNLQARANLKALLKVDMSLYANVINAFGLRSVTNFQDRDGPDFMRATGRQSPMSVLMGAKINY